MAELRMIQRVMASNDALAEQQLQELNRYGVMGVNIMSGPGAGKTSLIEATVSALKDKFRLWVIEGDIHGDLDARRITARGVGCTQINTQGACHLDGLMLSAVFPGIDWSKLDLLIIENVGNLVCPAEFRLPVHYNVTLVSTPEGSDKPVKYPLMFSKSDLVVISKIDLLPYVDFDVQEFVRSVRRLKPRLPVIRLSTRTGEGVEEWIDWLRKRLIRHRR